MRPVRPMHNGMWSYHVNGPFPFKTKQKTTIVHRSHLFDTRPRLPIR